MILLARTPDKDLHVTGFEPAACSSKLPADRLKPRVTTGSLRSAWGSCAPWMWDGKHTGTKAATNNGF